jgi:sulfite reductase (ferredoxin)
MAQIDAISKPEAIKQHSRQLRGHIARDLADTATPFDKEGYALLKFHGVYQGYDRDSATERKQRGEDKVWQFMVRARIPGGRLTADQYLALDAIAGRYANGSVRITTREGIQFHGVVKAGLKSAIAEVNGAMLTTLAACGDVVRNVTTVPAPIRDEVHRRLEADARRLSTHLLPRTSAYHEIWVEGAPWREGESAAEKPDPLYGERYLPRKFKMGLAIPEDNTIDVLTNDLAVVALFAGEHLTGYNFLLGGGHGMTHNMPQTYPRLATPVAFIEPEDLLAAAAAVVRLHRDHGDRGNRRHARLKYVTAEKGEDWARERLSEYLGKELEPCREMPAFKVPDHLGWREQGDGKLYLGIPVSSGRVADDGPSRIRTALREIVERFGCDPILMPSQDIILSEIGPQHRDTIEGLLRGYGVRLAEDLLPAGRALGAGLPGPANLRPGAHRSRTRSRRHRHRDRGPVAALRPRARAAQHPHHRLPERLCAALYRRYRHRRPHARFFHLVRRRRLRGHPAQYPNRRQSRVARNCRSAGSTLCTLRVHPPWRRGLRRFLPSCRSVGIAAST